MQPTPPTRTVLDQMREAWDSDRCPACGAMKIAREYWWCKMCHWRLPKRIQNALRYRPARSVAEWLRALAILKQAKENKVL